LDCRYIRNRDMLWISVLILFSIGLIGTLPRSVYSAEDVKKEVKEAGEAVSNWSRGKLKTFKQKTRKELDELNDDLEGLKKKGKKAQKKAAEDLANEKEKVQDDLDRLGSKGKASWEKLAEGIKKSVNELTNAIKKAANELTK